MLFWFIIITVLSLFCQAQDTISYPSVVPTCKSNDTSLIQAGTKLRVAVISHYSIVATFFANPEAAAREAASLLNMDLEWDRHVVSSSAKMKEDIQNALDSGVDGMIVSIPNQEIYETVKEATKTGIPIIVFNTGMEYAQKLGLMRVLQSDKKSAETMANELKRRNYTRPLAVQITSSRDLDEKTFSARANGISQYLGRPIDILSVTNDFDKALIEVENTFSSGSYDSIISLGGLAGVDLITAASLNIHKRSPDRRLTVAFYDAGSKRNMSDIFNTFPEAFGISQLPYYQASLPVFMMYIQLTTSYPPFINKTVNTGPNLVTKETYSEYVYGDGNSIIPGADLGANIGVVIINSEGDTYQSGIMAGIYDLAGKLNWTVTLAKEEGLAGNSSALKQHVKALVDGGVHGLILQSSDPTLLNYTVRLTDSHNVPLAVIGTFWESLDLGQYKNNSKSQQSINIITDSKALAASVAEKLVLDNFKKPVCFSAHTSWKYSGLCTSIYMAYKHQLGNSTDIPPINDFQHSINLSTVKSMENDFEKTLSSLRHRGYDPDVYIALSQNVFGAINYRILRGLMSTDTPIYSAVSQYDQFHAFLNGHLSRVWHYNTYANGFFALLNILLSKTTPYLAWQGEGLAVPEVTNICSPGEYYVELSEALYCVFKPAGVTSLSFRCLPCPEGTYSSKPDQPQCLKCPYGTFSAQGSTSCISCSENSNNDSPLHSQCVTYERDQAAKRRKIYVGVFVPIGILVVGGIVGFLVWQGWWKRKKWFSNAPAESTWLLSFDELMRPPMQHMSSFQTPSSLGNTSPVLTTPDVPLLSTGGSNNDLSNSTPETMSPQTDAVRTPELINTGRPIPIILAGRTQRTISDFHVNSSSNEEGEGNRQRSHSDTAVARDYFRLATVHNTSNLLYYSGKEYNGLIRAVGFHRNLPVFVKQIGFRRVHLNQTAYHEISLMKVARHPKLVEFIGICIEPQSTFIVEEYCSKGTLYDVLKNPDLDLTWIFRFSLINDLVAGLEFLHRSKFLFHGCLTSQACVITGRWELKITDYGLYKVRESQYDPVIVSSLLKRYPKVHHRTSVPTSMARGPSSITGDYESPMHIVPHYENLLWLAPESLLRTSFDIWVTYPSKKSDIYSLGIIMNEIVTRAQPYKKELTECGESNYEAVFDRIKADQLVPDMLSSDQDTYVGSVNEIIIACWRREAANRPAISQVKNKIKTIDPHITGSDNVVDNLALLLERYANDMENLVRKRTANLQQRTIELEEERARTENLLKDLKEAKEVAEAAAASKQNFLANMSHEIRTPMNAVIGMSRILMESNLPAELHDCAETIESSGNHLMTIIDDILDYSKIDSGKLTLEHRRMDLIFVFESAIKLIAPNYLDKGVVLWNTFEPDVATAVYGDVVRLRQILLNILSNALKFTKEGYVAIHVSRIGSAPSTPVLIPDKDSNSDNNNEEKKGLLSDNSVGQENMDARTEGLLISIRDTGIGIQKEKADKLFQTFSQVDASTTRNFGGTGLGLAISRKLSRMMGGDMWFESNYGHGSTFYVTVKLQKQADSPTYGSINCINEIAELCHSCVIVADNKYSRQGWVELLKSIRVSNIKALPFAEAEKMLKILHKDEEVSLLIIDEEFEMVEKMGTIPTTSQAVLYALQDRIPSIRSIPTLCMRDMRNQRQERLSDYEQQHVLPQLSKHAPTQQEDSPTPRLERKNPFEELASTSSEQRILYIVKPVKATKLLMALLKLLRPSETASDNDNKSTENGAQQQTTVKTLSGGASIGNDDPSRSFKRTKSDGKQIKGRGRSNTIVSTRSASSTTSSGRPFSEITGSVRSLLVDDNPVNQKVVIRMLSRLGVYPQIAQNGKEACDMVRRSKELETEESIDLIFMDIWMPEMNGFEASEYIRSNLSDSPVHPYIIAMTACVMPGDKEKCLNAGMNGYVSKPVRKDELEASLHTYTQVIVSESGEDSNTESPSIEKTDKSSFSSQEEEYVKPLPSVTVTVENDKHQFHNNTNNSI